MKKLYLYDAHSWYGDRRYSIRSDGAIYTIEVLDLAERPCEKSLVLIADELCATKLPFFFPRSARVALLKESPIYTSLLPKELLIRNFDLVLTHSADLIKLGPPFVRLDFSSNWVTRDPRIPSAFPKTKLVSFIGNATRKKEEVEGYAFRRRVFDMLQPRSDVDVYGIGYREVTYKSEALNGYCFSVAMENHRSNYYYTEKLIDCILTEAIPIYWGFPGIGELFDKRGIISFSSADELMKILDQLSFDMYKSMQPYVRENRKRCQDLCIDSFEGYFQRCIRTIEKYPGTCAREMNRLVTSKLAGGMRICRERFYGKFLYLGG